MLYSVGLQRIHCHWINQFGGCSPNSDLCCKDEATQRQRDRQHEQQYRTTTLTRHYLLKQLKF